MVVLARRRTRVELTRRYQLLFLVLRGHMLQQPLLLIRVVATVAVSSHLRVGCETGISYALVGVLERGLRQTTIATKVPLSGERSRNLSSVCIAATDQNLSRWNLSEVIRVSSPSPRRLLFNTSLSRGVSGVCSAPVLANPRNRRAVLN